LDTRNINFSEEKFTKDENKRRKIKQTFLKKSLTKRRKNRVKKK
jgi:hypothetical protein